VGTIPAMKTAGRPRGRRLDDYLELRLSKLEKRGFREAAKIAGLPLAAWARTRLRVTAMRELQDAGQSIAFLVDEQAQ